MSARYIELMRDADALAVAAAVGIQVVDGRGTSPGSFACPACGGGTRHGERRRGACGVTPNGAGWCCFSCQETGDAIDLVAFAVGGSKFSRLGDVARDEVRGWIQRHLGPAASQLSAAPSPPRPGVVRTLPDYPPATLIGSIWAESVRVDEDAEVSAWLESKRIDVDRVADLDLARALPSRSQAAPKWATGGWRVIVQLRDHTGAVRSLKARRLVSGDGPKSLSPTGFAASGLAFFDPRAIGAVRFWIVEGEKKFLQLATRMGDDGSTAVLGIGSGMYSPELIARIPPSAEVIIATDADPKCQAGAKYATDIANLLSPWQRRRARLWNSLEVVGSTGAHKVQVRSHWLSVGGKRQPP
jgi:hypothetical protein